MELSKETVQYVAQLARIELQDKELGKLSHQLKDILDFIDTLKLLDISSISPTTHALSLNTILREDQPGNSLPVEKSLANAPLTHDNFFVVPNVIE